MSLVKRVLGGRDGDNNDGGDTKVIVVLNTDKVRTVQGASSLQDLNRISLSRARGTGNRHGGGGDGDGDGGMNFVWTDGREEDTEEEEDGDELQELGSIGLRMAKLSENASAVGHVDSTLLSLVMQVLLKHADIGSIVMLRKSGQDTRGGSAEIVGSTDPSRTMLKLMAERRALSAANTVTTEDGARVLLVGEDSEHREDESVFRNRPSRAERSFLEERF